MGLSIHYSGTIKDKSQILPLIEEVQDVCKVFGWHYHLTNDEQLNGISFTPPECETLCLTFLPNGELASKIRLLYEIAPATIISVKTQFAEMHIHYTVIKLLRYLSKKYFSQFDLQDEGGYWETGDETVLAKKFDAYNGLLNTVQVALNSFNSVPVETKEEFVQRLEHFLKERLNK
jgi:hypothetical protein